MSELYLQCVYWRLIFCSSFCVLHTEKIVQPATHSKVCECMVCVYVCMCMVCEHIVCVSVSVREVFV